LAEQNNKLSNEIEDLKKEMICKEEDFTWVIDSFKEDDTQFYLVGFEIALEQAAIVHPTIDFSELDPGKTVLESW